MLKRKKDATPMDPDIGIAPKDAGTWGHACIRPTSSERGARLKMRARAERRTDFATRTCGALHAVRPLARFR
jgi:hypothetical protein